MLTVTRAKQMCAGLQGSNACSFCKYSPDRAKVPAKPDMIRYLLKCSVEGDCVLSDILEVGKE